MILMELWPSNASNFRIEQHKNIKIGFSIQHEKLKTLGLNNESAN